MSAVKDASEFERAWTGFAPGDYVVEMVTPYPHPEQ